MTAIIITIILSAIAGTMWALCAANKNADMPCKYYRENNSFCKGAKNIQDFVLNDCKHCSCYENYEEFDDDDEN